MSRSITTSSDYLFRTTPTLWPDTGAFFVRFKPNWSSGDGVGHTIILTYNLGAGVSLFQIDKSASEQLFAGWYTAGVSYGVVVPAFADFVAGQWHNILVDWDETSGETRLFFDGVLVDSVTNGLVVAPAQAELKMGRDYLGSTPADGSFAEAAVLDHVLDSGEIATLEETGNPACLSGVLHHWPMFGVASPEPDEAGSDDLSFIGSPAAVAHPATTGARSFTTGLLRASTPSTQGSAGAIFLRFKPTWNSTGDIASRYILRFFRGAPFVAVLDFLKESTGDLIAGFYDGGTDFRITVSANGLFNAGVWANWLMTWESGVTSVYLDNVLVASITNALTIPTSWDSVTVGASHDGSAASFVASGEIAEVAELDHAPDSAERVVLQSTGNPACLAGLIHHYHVGANAGDTEFDLVGSQDLTVMFGAAPITVPPTIGTCGGGGPTDQDIELEGVESGESIGSHALNVIQSLGLAGVPSGVSFGAPTVTPGAISLLLAGLPSAAAVGVPAVNVQQSVLLAGVPTGAAVGAPALQAAIALEGVESGESVGVPALSLGAFSIQLEGVESGESVGGPLVWVVGREAHRRLLRIEEYDRVLKIEPDEYF